MPTAKEIAEALRTAKTLDRDALRDIEAYTTAKAESGAPVALEFAVIDAAGECRDALRRLTEALGREHRERSSAMERLAHAGARFRGDMSSIVEQSNRASIVLVEAYSARRAAFHAMLDVFAAIGDRIVATPEEQAKAAAGKAAREATFRAAAIEAWCKLSATALATKATERGIDPGSMHKRDVAILLVDAGHRP